MRKDLFPGPVNYHEEEYKNFISEINNDKPLTKHKELERYHEDIKMLFQEYDIDYLVERDEYNTVYSWIRALNDAVFIATHLKGRKLSEKTIYDIQDRFYPTPYELTRLLSVIYCPEEMVKNFQEYIWYAEKVFFCGILCLYKDDKVETIDVDNPLLNELYNYEYQVYLYDKEKYEKMSKHRRFIALVIAYLHLNNKFSVEWFNNFVENIDEYYNLLTSNETNENGEKIKIDDIEDIWVAYELPTAHPIYKKMFDNLDNVPIKRNKLISKDLKTSKN